MDTIQFIENVLDIKLLDYQKEMISYMEEHPDCKVILPRTRSSPSWYMTYVISKAMKEEKMSVYKRDKKCPVCGYKKFKDEHYAEECYGIVEQHCYCDRCGYTIEQCYSEPIDGFYPPIRRGGKDYKGVYHPKNWRKRKRIKRKYGIKYGNKDWMLIYT